MRPDDSLHTLDTALYPKASSGFTLREFLIIAFKDRKRIAWGFIIPMLLAIGISFIPTPRYEAVSTVLVRMGREYLYRPEVGDATNQQPIVLDRDQALHAEVEIIGSRDQLESVINQVGVERLYPAIAAKKEDSELPHKSEAVLEMQRRLDVLLLKDTNIIQISFKHPDPKISAEVVNRLVDNYLEKRRSIFSDAKVAFAESQARSVFEKLNALEAKIETFKRENNIVSLSEQLSLLLNQRDEIEKRLKDADTNLVEAVGKLGDADRAYSLSSDMRVNAEANEAIESARKTVVDLRAKESDALTKYTEKHPLITDLRKRIRQAEAHLHDLEVKWTTTVRSTLKSQLAEVNAQITKLNDRDRELNSMLRERQLLDTSYQNYVKKLDDARVTESLDRKEKTSVSIVQRALVPIEKKKLQPIIVLVGFFFSICIALVAAFISELLRDTFISPERLERALGLPVLATIPYREVLANRRSIT